MKIILLLRYFDLKFLSLKSCIHIALNLKINNNIRFSRDITPLRILTVYICIAKEDKILRNTFLVA